MYALHYIVMYQSTPTPPPPIIGIFGKLVFKFPPRVKYITEDAASVCMWYLKFHMHMDEFRMPEMPSVDLRHDLHVSCLMHAPRYVT